MADQGAEHIRPDIERRQYRRVKLVTHVKCEALSRDELLVTRDVSAGGLFITTKAPFPLNAEVTVSFRLGPQAPVINSRRQVVNPVAGLGMGIQFDDLSEDARAAIQKFVDESL